MTPNTVEPVSSTMTLDYHSESILHCKNVTSPSQIYCPARSDDIGSVAVTGAAHLLQFIYTVKSNTV